MIVTLTFFSLPSYVPGDSATYQSLSLPNIHSPLHSPYLTSLAGREAGSMRIWHDQNWLSKYIVWNPCKPVQVRVRPELKKLSNDRACNENQNDFIHGPFTFLSNFVFRKQLPEIKAQNLIKFLKPIDLNRFFNCILQDFFSWWFTNLAIKLWKPDPTIFSKLKIRIITQQILVRKYLVNPIYRTNKVKCSSLENVFYQWATLYFNEIQHLSLVSWVWKPYLSSFLPFLFYETLGPVSCNPSWSWIKVLIKYYLISHLTFHLNIYKKSYFLSPSLQFQIQLQLSSQRKICLFAKVDI